MLIRPGLARRIDSRAADRPIAGIMSVFLSDVDLGSFAMTNMYSLIVTDTPWSPGGDYGGEKST